MGPTYQIEDGHLHHTLVEVGRLVLDDLDGHDFLCFEILALDDLAEGALTKNIENEVTVPKRREEVLVLVKKFEEESVCMHGGEPSYLCPASSEPRMSLT